MKRSILYRSASVLIATIAFAVGALYISALAFNPSSTIDQPKLGNIAVQKHAQGGDKP